MGLFHTQGMPLDTWAVNENRLSEDELLYQAEEILKENISRLNFELNRFQEGGVIAMQNTPSMKKMLRGNIRI